MMMNNKQGARLIRLGQCLGVVCGLVASGLHIRLLVPLVNSSNDQAVIIQLAMVGVALLAGYGAVAPRPNVLLLAFVVSFVPIGFYLLTTPSIFRVVGVANIGYAVAGIIVGVGQDRQ